jgi:hypothetical protein
MLADIWHFLQDETNRAVLAWIGGGVAVLVSGLWAGFTFLFNKGKKGAPAQIIKATHGSVAAGRDIRDNEIDTRGGPKH